MEPPAGKESYKPVLAARLSCRTQGDSLHFSQHLSLSVNGFGGTHSLAVKLEGENGSQFLGTRTGAEAN